MPYPMAAARAHVRVKQAGTSVAPSSIELGAFDVWANAYMPWGMLNPDVDDNGAFDIWPNSGVYWPVYALTDSVSILDENGDPLLDENSARVQEG